MIQIESKIGQVIRTIRPGDQDFMIRSIVTLCPRASIELSTACPQHVVDIISNAYQRGWLKAVANVPDNELMWERLGE